MLKSDFWSQRREAVRDYCEARPVLLEKKRPHLHREKLYKQQLVSNIVHIKGLNLNWCLGGY